MKKLLSMLPDWVEKGYVERAVWKGVSEFVSRETIASALNKSESSVNISNSDVSASRVNQMDRILSHVSQYLYPSELKEFAVKRLGLRETRYEMVEEDHIYGKRRNFEVSVKTNQWWIQVFREGSKDVGGSANLLLCIIFAKNCMKMDKNYTEREMRVPHIPSIDLPLVTKSAVIVFLANWNLCNYEINYNI